MKAMKAMQAMQAMQARKETGKISSWVKGAWLVFNEFDGQFFITVRFLYKINTLGPG